MPNLDKNVFVNLFSELQARHKHDFSPLIIRISYEYLDEHLTTSEFEQAFRVAVNECSFMPTNKDLVAFVKVTLMCKLSPSGIDV